VGAVISTLLLAIRDGITSNDVCVRTGRAVKGTWVLRSHHEPSTSPYIYSLRHSDSSRPGTIFSNWLIKHRRQLETGAQPNHDKAEKRHNRNQLSIPK